jgi:hypothetical protein
MHIENPSFGTALRATLGSGAKFVTTLTDVRDCAEEYLQSGRPEAAFLT